MKCPVCRERVSEDPMERAKHLLSEKHRRAFDTMQKPTPPDVLRPEVLHEAAEKAKASVRRGKVRWA